MPFGESSEGKKQDFHVVTRARTREGKREEVGKFTSEINTILSETEKTISEEDKSYPQLTFFEGETIGDNRIQIKQPHQNIRFSAVAYSK